MAGGTDSPIQGCGGGSGNNPGGDNPKDKDKYIQVKVSDKDSGKSFSEVILHIQIPGDDFFEPTTDENGEMKLFVKDSGDFKLLVDWKTLVTEKIPISQMLIIQ